MKIKIVLPLTLITENFVNWLSLKIQGSSLLTLKRSTRNIPALYGMMLRSGKVKEEGLSYYIWRYDSDVEYDVILFMINTILAKPWIL